MIRTFMPKWGLINERRGQLHEVIRLSGANLVVNDNDHSLLIKVASLPTSRVQVYFIDNDDYFSRRRMTVDENGKEFADNGERAIFFAKGVLETVKKLRWRPDVIVCQGWMTALVPIYVKTVYNEEPCFAVAKVIYSLFAEGFNGELEDNFRQCIEYREVTSDMLRQYKEKFDYAELNKLAVDFSDGVAVASPSVDSGLVNYLQNRNIPVAECSGGDVAASYKSFIEEINK